MAFVWLKKNRKADSWFYGLGFWTRANAEVCLLATRGRPRRQAASCRLVRLNASLVLTLDRSLGTFT